jgi:hypothetical protein
VLTTRVVFEGKEVEILYSGYITFRLLCIFSDSLTRCAECVRRGVRCDDNFSIDDFDRLTAK